MAGFRQRKISPRRAKRRGIRNWQMVINKPARQYLRVWLKAKAGLPLTDEEQEVMQDEVQATFAYQQLILRPMIHGLSMHAVTNNLRIPDNPSSEFMMAIVKKAGQLAGAFDRMIMVQQPNGTYVSNDVSIDTLYDPDEYRDPPPDKEHNRKASWDDQPWSTDSKKGELK